MSATEEEAANTGVVPPAPSGNENAFENVNLNGNAEVSENLGEVGSSEPVESAQEPSASANVNASIIPNESVVPTMSAMSKSGKPMSAKQSDLQRLRSETLEDMREKYSERFGNTSMYPKPPKAKVYHASGLTSIRQRNGEEAYKAALNRIMDANDPLKKGNSSTAAANSGMGKNMFKTTTLKKSKSKKNASANASANSFMPSQLTAAANSSMNRGSTNTIIESIETMGSSAKGLIDTMISTSKALARELAKTGNVSAMSQLASVANNSARVTAKPKRSRGKRTTKKSTGLSSIPEETSANMGNNSALAPVSANM